MGSDFTAHNRYYTNCSLHKLKKYKNTIFFKQITRFYHKDIVFFNCYLLLSTILLNLK